jgi:hypothetical protein
MSEDLDDDNFPLRFGKYQGRTPKELIETDPSYVVWLFDNTDVAISEELYDAALESIEDDTLKDTYDLFNRER